MHDLNVARDFVPQICDGKTRSWASHLRALLLAKELQEYTRLLAEERCNYDLLKKALLDRYRLNAESFHSKLR